MAYAQNTEVSVDRSRLDIEKTLKRYGADSFAYATQGNKALIIFRMCNRQIRFVLELPDINSREFAYTPSRGTRRTPAAQEAEWEQACRSRWRSLYLVIKAKLEAIETGISIFENEFMANILLPNNQTVGEFMLPQIDEVYELGTMPPMLPMLGGGSFGNGGEK